MKKFVILPYKLLSRQSFAISEAFGLFERKYIHAKISKSVHSKNLMNFLIKVGIFAGLSN